MKRLLLIVAAILINVYCDAQIPNLSALKNLLGYTSIDSAQTTLKAYNFIFDNIREIKKDNGRVSKVYTYTKPDYKSGVNENIILFKEDSKIKFWFDEVVYLSGSDDNYFNFKQQLSNLSGTKSRGEKIQDDCIISSYWNSAIVYSFMTCKDKQLQVNQYSVILQNDF